MIVLEKIKETKNLIKKVKKEGKKIGFVPTMGCLHEGHLSLIRKAKSLSDFVVVSIFVNPIQFGPNEDYDRYPRTFERDCKLCEKEGVDLIFHPDVSEMYPSNFSTFVEVEGQISSILCGIKRPGHFKGVTTVVSKLFNIVEPDVAIFGQKDAQQAFIIKKMVKDLNFDIEIIVSDIIREEDGLAMSSRNTYLNEEERKVAPLIYKGLTEALKLFKNGERDSEVLKNKVRETICTSSLFRIDYIEVVDLKSFSYIDRVDDEALLAVAVFLGKTRLIDNIILR